MIDTTFKVYTDANGSDPDYSSPTLRRYHKILWSKPLPGGGVFTLSDNHAGVYLFNKSEHCVFILGSDSITHSYRNHKRKCWITSQIPNEVDELFEAGSTIGAFTIFPNNRIDGRHTINQARGMIGLIDDRFDLTLECIRRLYLGQGSPLYETLSRYENFFGLFADFDGYVKFFLLDDLIDVNRQVKFYLPFDDFKTKPAFFSVDDYLEYKRGVMDFINSRNQRIEAYMKNEIDKNACP